MAESVLLHVHVGAQCRSVTESTNEGDDRVHHEGVSRICWHAEYIAMTPIGSCVWCKKSSLALAGLCHWEALAITREVEVGLDSKPAETGNLTSATLMGNRSMIANIKQGELREL